MASVIVLFISLVISGKNFWEPILMQKNVHVGTDDFPEQHPLELDPPPGQTSPRLRRARGKVVKVIRRKFWPNENQKRGYGRPAGRSS